jgi:hypothetical protein
VFVVELHGVFQYNHFTGSEALIPQSELDSHGVCGCNICGAREEAVKVELNCIAVVLTSVELGSKDTPIFATNQFLMRT